MLKNADMRIHKFFNHYGRMQKLQKRTKTYTSALKRGW